jgi:hypothetical protein
VLAEGESYARRSRYNERVQTFRRRLFAIVSVLSLILFLATSALWIRSCWWYDNFKRAGNIADRIIYHDIGSENGYVEIRWFDSRSGFMGTPQWRFSSMSVSQLPPRLSDHETTFAFAPEGWYLFFPLWLPAILFAITPSYWLLGPRRRLKRRRRLGLCLGCGYDLRASPERCPECGVAVTAR